MKEFKVTVEIITRATIVVTARNKQEAEEVAENSPPDYFSDMNDFPEIHAIDVQKIKT